MVTYRRHSLTEPQAPIAGHRPSVASREQSCEASPEQHSQRTEQPTGLPKEASTVLWAPTGQRTIPQPPTTGADDTECS